MLQIPESVFNEALITQGAELEKISGLSAHQIMSDILNPDKPKEQLAILGKYYPGDVLSGKKLLEIGSGFGILVAVATKEFGMDAWGAEPDGVGFSGSFKSSLEILKANNLSADRIIDAAGESLPFDDASFDIVYSTNVLEHVTDPGAVIKESIRVCRPNGIIQIVVPNYGSFFDGHYACFYLPYQPKWLWKFWLKHLLRRDPSYADTLRTEINYFTLKKWLRPFIESGSIEVLDFGEDIFIDRMRNANFSDWAGLVKVRRWLGWLQWLHVNQSAALLLSFLKSHTPIILTLKRLR